MNEPTRSIATSAELNSDDLPVGVISAINHPCLPISTQLVERLCADSDMQENDRGAEFVLDHAMEAVTSPQVIVAEQDWQPSERERTREVVSVTERPLFSGGQLRQSEWPTGEGEAVVVSDEQLSSHLAEVSSNPHVVVLNDDGQTVG